MESVYFQVSKMHFDHIGVLSQELTRFLFVHLISIITRVFRNLQISSVIKSLIYSLEICKFLKTLVI